MCLLYCHNFWLLEKSRDSIKCKVKSTTTQWRIGPKLSKRHIYTQAPFIWTYNEVSMTFSNKVLDRISFEKLLFWALWQKSTNFRWPHSVETVKRRSYISSPYGLPFKSSSPCKLIFRKKTLFFLAFWQTSANFRWPNVADCEVFVKHKRPQPPQDWKRHWYFVPVYVHVLKNHSFWVFWTN